MLYNLSAVRDGFRRPQQHTDKRRVRFITILNDTLHFGNVRGVLRRQG